MIIVTVAALGAVTVAATVVVGAGGDGGAPPAALPDQMVRTESDVTLPPRHVDGTGAEFDVVLDTHAVELHMDLAAGATLRVPNREWLPAGLEGEGPGGHHRECRLRFPASGPEGSAFELHLAGFDTPVTTTWTDEGDR